MDKSLRTIAMYLPQFHRVKENDLWWGEGFTEWTAVRNAKPLFKGHDQPRMPLNKNYYNLMEKNVMVWQSELAKKYLVDGFCFWHYWFKDGRKILEKPAENLLQWKDVDMPFCFCWANETWARTWSNISAPNYWTTEYEPSEKEGDNGILLEQDYGDKKQWEEHFYYLLPFFRDERYIRYKGHPVFIIFRPFLIGCISEMMECWQDLAKLNNIEAPYLIGYNLQKIVAPYNANIIDILGSYNAYKTYLKKGEYGNVKGSSYEDVWESYFNLPVLNKKGNMICGCVGYDTTPRNGTSGTILFDNTPERFQQYFEMALHKSKGNDSPFLFINAWNEWAEGNYLEPDESNGYKYLEAIKKATAEFEASSQDQVEKKITAHTGNQYDQLEIMNTRINKFKSNYYLLAQWMRKKIQGKDLGGYLYAKGYKRVAIYGWGDIGRLLADDLEKSSIELSYIIDRRGEALKASKIKVYQPIDKNLPPVDVIIVSVVDEFLEIYAALRKKISSKIVSLATVINEY